MRQEALHAYGGRCACCGETEQAFLVIDHIANDGAEHRRALGHTRIYDWLRQNGYPAGFQVLCHNCNEAKFICGECPHQTKKEGSLS